MAAEPVPVVRSCARMREMARELRGDGGTLALVPTMGKLHEGHLSLVDRARELADAVVVSVFVNPTQFGPAEDFGAYPRDLEGDVARAAGRGAAAVFAPEAEEMYPRPQTIWVQPGPLADRLCGASRPGHFRGVLTVVLKLLNVVRPDVAVFGRKDFQQSVLVGRMLAELNLPVRLEVAPIVREPDGLAKSSRNFYLSPEERGRAVRLSAALREARAAFAAGERDASVLCGGVRGTLEEGGVRVDYVEIVDPATLEPVSEVGPEDVCALAGFVGETRLIDNAPLSGASTLPE